MIVSWSLPPPNANVSLFSTPSLYVLPPSPSGANFPELSLSPVLHTLWIPDPPSPPLPSPPALLTFLFAALPHGLCTSASQLFRLLRAHPHHPSATLRPSVLRLSASVPSGSASSSVRQQFVRLLFLLRFRFFPSVITPLPLSLLLPDPPLLLPFAPLQIGFPTS